MIPAYRASQTYYLVGCGDSIANSYQMPSITFGYQRYASDKLGGVSWVNKGQNGQTSTQILARYTTDVYAYNPSVVIVEGGTNDYNNAIPKETTVSNLQAMVTGAISNGALLVVFLPIMYYANRSGLAQADVDYINAQMIAWMSANHPTHLVVNVDQPFIDKKTIDALHPSAKGYQAIGETIGDAILAL